jgi:hypothetical protein
VQAATFALALSPLAAAQQGGSNDELAVRATDPIAALMSFQLSNWYTPSFHGRDGSANQVVFRAAIPFGLAGSQHIFRVTQPYVTSSPSGAAGLADTALLDLMVIKQPWGGWGLGVSGTLPTGDDGLSADKWTAGPAAGFVNASNKQYRWGLLMQSFFSFAGEDRARDVGIIHLQPITSYGLGGGRSLSLGNSGLIYDTERSRWASLLASVNYGQIVTFRGHKWRPNIEAGYDFKDAPGNPKWTIRIGVALLVPAL